MLCWPIENRASGRVAGIVSLLLCFIVGPTIWREAQRTQIRTSTPRLPGVFNLQFAIADLDGDQKADLATVGIERFGSHSTDYLIGVRLSSGVGQWITVTGPLGVPQIVARDVNGDNAQDLIVSTAAHPQPIAVLLNDGHGNFKRADTADFSGAICDASSNWGPVEREVQDAYALVCSRTSLSESNIDNVFCIPQNASELSFVTNQEFTNPLSSSPLSRSPPTFA